MTPARHLFVCTGAGTAGRLGCASRGGATCLTTLRHQRPAGATWHVNATDCLGSCSDGPNAIAFPDGHFYNGLTRAHVEEIVSALNSGAALPIPHDLTPQTEA